VGYGYGYGYEFWGMGFGVWGMGHMNMVMGIWEGGIGYQIWGMVGMGLRASDGCSSGSAGRPCVPHRVGGGGGGGLCHLTGLSMVHDAGARPRHSLLPR
jgi:hypothetical protein